MEVLGVFDELNASIGWLIVVLPVNHETHELLVQTQSVLFSCGSYLADPGEIVQGMVNVPNASLLRVYESSIDEITALLPPLERFILPGGGELAARAHIVRSVVRRAERVLVRFRDGGEIIDPHILQFVNRLSDWFFTLARFYNYEAKITEQIWESRSSS